jgi:hypothetical protein
VDPPRGYEAFFHIWVVARERFGGRRVGGFENERRAVDRVVERARQDQFATFLRRAR